MRWIWKLDGKTSGYLVREERNGEKMRMRLGRRAIEYERKLEEGGRSE